MDLSILPDDIKWNIAHYITDVETRRYYNIYGKIDLSKYDFLKTIIRVPLTNLVWDFVSYEFEENYEITKNNTPYRVTNDLMNTYKLKKRPYLGYVNISDIFHFRTVTEEYYWQVIEIEYDVK
jgi:hypothetical protein